MTARTRSRDLRTTLSGTYWSNIGPTTITATKSVGVTETTQDHVGNFTVVNPLSIKTDTRAYPSLSGTLFQSGVKAREFTDFPIGYKPGPTDPWAGFPAFTTPQLSALAWQILAGTNPSAPHVSIPTFLGELKDFLKLIKGNGESVLDLFKGGKKAKVFLKSLRGWSYGSLRSQLSARSIAVQIAEGYISYRWALRPLYHDLMALCRFQKAVNDRLTWLYRLRKGDVLRRKVHLGTSKITGPSVFATLHSQGAIIDGRRQVDFTREVWGTAQWKLKPDSKLPQLGAGRLNETAHLLAGGFTSAEVLATAWQLMPWSWLIDWFTDIETTILATNNSIGCLWQNIALMVKTSSVATFTVTTKPAWVDLNGFYYERSVRKERFPVVPLLPFSFSVLPILDSGKWSILGALASSRLLSPR